MMRLILPALTALILLGGCATITGTPTQAVSIVVLDHDDRAVENMRCSVANGAEEYRGNSPLLGLVVRRSASDLEIECRRGAQFARATAVSRGRLAQLLPAILPGGTVMIAVDHLSGYRYSYPTSMHLRLGEHLIFDADDAALGQATYDARAQPALH